jgi:transcriptional regulator with XRE-family HTH domain
MNPMTPAQCRMARSALGISADELADRAGIAVNTVRRFEKNLVCNTSTVAALSDALKSLGVLFREDETAEWVGLKLARLALN